MFVLLLFVSLGPALAQAPQITFGALGGVRLSSLGSYDESRRYTVGPSIEAQFGDHFAVEFDALYKRVGYSFAPLGAMGMVGAIVGAGSSPVQVEVLSYALRNRAHSWEFPIMGKYYFGDQTRPHRFFVGTGYSFQRSWTTTEVTVVQKQVDSGELLFTNQRSTYTSPSTVGAVFGAGFTRKTGRITIAPSFRYTRWGLSAGGLTRNQSEFLLGVRF